MHTLIQNLGYDAPSVITSKAAIHDHLKTGQRRPSGAKLFCPSCSPPASWFWFASFTGLLGVHSTPMKRDPA